MCVVSMIMDHYNDKWPKPSEIKPYFPPQPIPYPNLPTQAEIDEFRKLLERAREYDKNNNEPDCELEEKKEKIRELAKLLGLDVSFL